MVFTAIISLTMSMKKYEGTSSKEVRISITTNTLFRVLAVVAVVAALFYLQNIVAIVVASLLLAAVMDPFADKLQKRKISRGVSVGIVYLLFFAIIAGISVLIVPTLVNQSKQLLTKYAPYIEEASGGTVSVDKIFSGDFFEQDFNALFASIKDAGIVDALPDVLSVATEIFGGVIMFLLILIISFYMVVEDDALRKGVLALTPKKYESMVRNIVPKARAKIGAWLRGQLFIMFVIFLVSYILLLALGVPYALVLALIAGLLEMIPFLGPILSAVPAIIVGLTISPTIALIIAIGYFGIQQLEGDVLTPKVMQKIGGLNPVISILAVIIGWEAFRIIGALLAIPVAMVIGVFLKEIFSHKKALEEE